MPIAWDDLEPHNDLLHDERWVTGLTYHPGSPFRATNVATFPPFTNDIEYLVFSAAAGIHVLPPAFPFIMDESLEKAAAVVSYPDRTDGEECDCHLGGRIIAIPDCHTFETGIVGYTEPMDFRFIINTMGALARIEGYDTEDCLPPPRFPNIDSTICADPGDTVFVYGNNLVTEANIVFEEETLEVNWIDSTHISFIIPEWAWQAVHLLDYSTALGDLSFSLQVYCEWLRLNFLNAFCGEIGDIISFEGTNISLDATMTFGGLPIPDYEISSTTAGWFRIPDIVGCERRINLYGDAYIYKVCIENSPIQIDCIEFSSPCPCPPDTFYDAVIRNINFYEKTNGSDTVIINYDFISDAIGNIGLLCSNDRGFSQDITFGSVSGAIGMGIAPGESLEIVWDAGADVPGIEGNDFSMELLVMGAVEDAHTVFGADTIEPYAQFKEGIMVGAISKIEALSDDGSFAKAVSNAGIFDNNDKFDIAIPNPELNSGHVFVFDTDSLIGQIYDENNSIKLSGENDGDAFGNSIDCIGDINGDGFDELLIGAPNCDEATWDAGRAYVFYGGRTSGDYNASDAEIIINGEDLAEFFGRRVSFAGDINSDSIPDFMVAAPSNDGGGRSSGRVYIFFGDSFPTEIEATDADIMITGTVSSSLLGIGMSNLGDFNGDGVDDIAITSLKDDRLTINKTFIFYGGTGLSGSYTTEDADITIIDSLSTDRASSISSAGDFNQDGLNDLIIGTSNISKVHIFLGGIHPDTMLNTDADIIIEDTVTVDIGCCFGIYVKGGGDLNDDGFDDILVANPNLRYGGTNSAYIFYGSDSLSDLYHTNFDLLIKPTTSSERISFATAAAFLPDIDYDDAMELIITDWNNDRAFIYSFIRNCPSGGIHYIGSSESGPLDTKIPEISVDDITSGSIEETVDITWTVSDSFIPPFTTSPIFPIKIYYCPTRHSTWRLIATSDNSDSSYTWTYPEVTVNAQLKLCVIDSFGHENCDSTNFFNIIGDDIAPTGHIAADSCNPDSILFILDDNEAIDTTDLWLMDSEGIRQYPDGMYWSDETTLVFFPRPEIPLPGNVYLVRFFSGGDISGNSFGEHYIEDNLVHRYSFCGCVQSFVNSDIFYDAGCEGPENVEIRYILETDCPDSSFDIRMYYSNTHHDTTEWEMAHLFGEDASIGDSISAGDYRFEWFPVHELGLEYEDSIFIFLETDGKTNFSYCDTFSAYFDMTGPSFEIMPRTYPAFSPLDTLFGNIGDIFAEGTDASCLLNFELCGYDTSISIYEDSFHVELPYADCDSGLIIFQAEDDLCGMRFDTITISIENIAPELTDCPDSHFVLNIGDTFSFDFPAIDEGEISYSAIISPEEAYVFDSSEFIWIPELEGYHEIIIISEDRAGFADSCIFYADVFEESIEENLPVSYEISIEIIPNPFNESCRIEIDTQKQGRLNIFSVLGENLANFDVATGQSKFLWNAEGMQSGIYFFMFESMDKVLIEKAILAK
ncbi:MAG: hypothetical protein ACLFSQ_04590 [Candidatus Zixiibacteriota bacterium]